MDARGTVIQPDQNPYVGPRPFSRDEKDKFFGRERESRDLLSLVLSERLLLFYAQSGAGKTSLINTSLVPGLEAKNFEVLPIGRVSGELLPGMEVDNIYTTNLMLKLDMGVDDPLRFKGLRLAQFLVNLAYDGKGFYYQPPSDQSTSVLHNDNKNKEPEEGTGKYQIIPRVLIIDQFEELFTTHPEAWTKREDFIRQLAEAMQSDPYLWVVLSMREDHIAGLDPYAALLPGGLRMRYYMQRLTVDAALEAVTQPVAKLRPFEAQAAKELVENLSRISAGRKDSDTPNFVPGEFVEPVQLQVVCYQLWEDIKDLPGDRITLDNLHRLARGQDLARFVNQALADFYQASLEKVLRQSKARVSEKKLRDWFANQLITEAKTRGFVFMGENTTGGIPNEMVKLLEGQLLRGENRAGGRWYELVHDRFIDPILQSNQAWEHTQQRKTRYLVIGTGIVLLIFFLILAGVTNQSTSNAAQAENALGVIQYSRATANVILGDSVETLTALEAVSTEKAVEAQLLKFTAEAASSAIAGMIQSTAQAQTAQALEVINANSATQQAATATADWLVQDDDRDGLLNQQELQLGTLPGVADTDQDGLSDGDEVTGGTNPLVADTDGDGLKDGEEVSRGLNPLNPDTDGDGITDALDPDPGRAPTAIPTPGNSRLTPVPTGGLIVTEQGPSVAYLQSQLEAIKVTQTALASPSRELIIGQTAKGSQIWVNQLGTGTRNIVLVGGLHAGFAPATVQLADYIADYFKKNMDRIPADVKLHIIAEANPDSPIAPGEKAGRLNSNGVDLNRNWDCEWKQNAKWGSQVVSGGSQPFSEPETKVLREYFLRTQPVGVVFWEARASGGLAAPGGCGLQSLFSESLAKIYGNAAGYKVAQFEAYSVNGDATNWLDAQGIPAISVLLPDYDNPDLEANLKAVQVLLEAYRQ